MHSDLFDYQLPPELIAQHPVEPRDAARLLVAGPDGVPHHRQVRDLPSCLRAGDLLVLNRTRVLRARLRARKESGGEVEVLLVHREPGAAAGTWRVMIKGRVRVGTRLHLPDCRAKVTVCHPDGSRSLRLPPDLDVAAWTERHGQIPLPPYIRRAPTPADTERYQSVFADRPGSVAAPTASLHLTDALLAELDRRGVERTLVELTIGPGTFRPVTSERIEDFAIHHEHCRCPEACLEAIAACRKRGGRVVAVGTTVVRTLETAARQPDGPVPFTGWTDLFMHPPDRLRLVDLLLTNFHLPRSSLLMLVACITGIDRLHELYRIAIAERYRFFSYGDAMLVGGLMAPFEGAVKAEG